MIEVAIAYLIQSSVLNKSIKIHGCGSYCFSSILGHHRSVQSFNEYIKPVKIIKIYNTFPSIHSTSRSRLGFDRKSLLEYNNSHWLKDNSEGLLGWSNNKDVSLKILFVLPSPIDDSLDSQLKNKISPIIIECIDILNSLLSISSLKIGTDWTIPKYHKLLWLYVIYNVNFDEKWH